VSRPFAVFDIDGTLIRWQLYHAMADELARRGHFETSAYQKVKAARMTWKKRESAESFKQYERALVELVDVAISGISVADLQAACETVIEEYKDQVYGYTRDLIRELKAKGYLIFAVSGSPLEIVSLLARHYGFDDYAGSHYTTKNGRYTGAKDVLKGERKPAVLEQLISKHSAERQGSIGVGDSESDILMLEEVDQAIAFNPTLLLFEHAKQRSWKVVVERKNMIYELEPRDGSYVLAQTGK
jgi:HAD superfamily hydrolase (TIGR01490 family)